MKIEVKVVALELYSENTGKVTLRAKSQNGPDHQCFLYPPMAVFEQLKLGQRFEIVEVEA